VGSLNELNAEVGMRKSELRPKDILRNFFEVGSWNAEVGKLNAVNGIG